MRVNDQLMTWAAAAIGCDVLDIQPLHEDQGPWRVADRYVLRAPTPRIDAAMVATGVAALQVAERYELPAPRLIDADLTGERAGVPASLETVEPGTTAWPVGTPATLRAAGAALTRLHSVSLHPQDHLPFRPRPIAVDDFAADRRRGLMPTTPLLQQADERVTAHGLPPEDPAFLHGDVWPGNLLWSGDQLTAFIDWKTAGVGAPGVDLSELRKQAAITFGPHAPTHVLTGWEQAAGRTAQYIAYWDAVAALNTPTTLGDWGISAATARRDRFLETALTHL